MEENIRVIGHRIGSTTEEEFWVPRSTAVCVMILCKGEVLLEKRGPGCPDEVGKYCMPCGYLGRNETIPEAAVREVYEETGLMFSTSDLHPAGINDSPSANRQNITHRFLIEIDDTSLIYSQCNLDSESRGGEKDECSEMVLANIDAIKNEPDDSFAFNHKKVILEILENKQEILSNNYCKYSNL